MISLVNLRNNTILRFFAILLFSFELLAPAFLGAPACEFETHEGSSAISLQPSHTLTSLLFVEERNEEERNSRDFFLTENFLAVSWFATASLTENKALQIFQVGDKFNTHPPLFHLHCVFQI